MTLRPLLSSGISRRAFAAGLAAPLALDLLGQATPAFAAPTRGGTLTISIDPEPPVLESAVNSSAPVYAISPKMHDGLVSYATDFTVTPSLATAWEIAPDGLSITFHLRGDVVFHDGKPFTSADVQFTFMEILKKVHPRGTSTFLFLTAVDTPDEKTAIFRFSRPSPYVMRALAAAESPIVAKHVYAGSDPLKNPANTAPIGTGPFKFAEWQRGSYVRLVRNDKYWDAPKPYLDEMIMRFIPDSAARAAALESGELQYGAQYVVPLNDVARLKKNPKLEVSTAGFEYNTSVNYLEFNLRRPQWQDVRVRRAIAHAVDQKFIVDNIWFGYATPADGPITNRDATFHTTDVPKYPFNLDTAAKLLDEAGMTRQANGQRFKTTINYSPSGDTYLLTAQVLKQNLSKLGIDASIVALDNPNYLRRVYTDNDFDINIFSLSNIADPVIGIHRLYSSKTIQKGVAYSNGSGYSNPAMDSILEAAQTEIDPVKRQKLYRDMQQLEMTDLPNYPVVYMQWFSIYDKDVKGLNSNALGPYDSFAGVSVDS